MFSKLLTFATLAIGLVAHANAACQFDSLATIFPDDFIVITEQSADGSVDSGAQVMIDTASTLPANNKYYLLDVFFTTGTYTHDSEAIYDSTTAMTASQNLLTSADLSNGLQSCSRTIGGGDTTCTATYGVEFVIGAAPDCTGYSDSKYVYHRALYSASLTITYEYIDGQLDVTNWAANIQNGPTLITGQDVIKTEKTFTAENVEVQDAFTVTSALTITKYDGSALGDAICLGAESSAIVADMDNGGATADHNNYLVTCKATATATMDNAVSDTTYSSNADAGADDSDLDEDSKVYPDATVGLSLAQYSLGAGAPGTATNSEVMAARDTITLDTAAANASANADGDYRWDLCSVDADKDGLTSLVRTGVADASASTSSYTAGIHDHDVTCNYLLQRPAGPAAAVQSPLVEVAAWFSYDLGTSVNPQMNRRLLRSAQKTEPHARSHLAKIHLAHA